MCTFYNRMNGRKLHEKFDEIYKIFVEFRIK